MKTNQYHQSTTYDVHTHLSNESETKHNFVLDPSKVTRQTGLVLCTFKFRMIGITGLVAIGGILTSSHAGFFSNPVCAHYSLPGPQDAHNILDYKGRAFTLECRQSSCLRLLQLTSEVGLA